MCKAVFGVDDIHKLRIDLADRRSKMTLEEAQNDFNTRVTRMNQMIEDARKAKQDKNGHHDISKICII